MHKKLYIKGRNSYRILIVVNNKSQNIVVCNVPDGLFFECSALLVTWCVHKYNSTGVRGFSESQVELHQERHKS